VLFYGVVSAQTETVVEFFSSVTQPRRWSTRFGKTSRT